LELLICISWIIWTTGWIFWYRDRFYAHPVVNSVMQNLYVLLPSIFIICPRSLARWNRNVITLRIGIKIKGNYLRNIFPVASCMISKSKSFKSAVNFCKIFIPVPLRAAVSYVKHIQHVFQSLIWPFRISLLQKFLTIFFELFLNRYVCVDIIVSKFGEGCEQTMAISGDSYYWQAFLLKHTIQFMNSIIWVCPCICLACHWGLERLLKLRIFTVKVINWLLIVGLSWLLVVWWLLLGICLLAGLKGSFSANHDSTLKLFVRLVIGRSDYLRGLLSGVNHFLIFCTFLLHRLHALLLLRLHALLHLLPLLMGFLLLILILIINLFLVVTS